MKIQLTIQRNFEFDPEDFIEVNEEGKRGPIPSNEEILKTIKDDPFAFIDAYALLDVDEIFYLIIEG